MKLVTYTVVLCWKQLYRSICTLSPFYYSVVYRITCRTTLSLIALLLFLTKYFIRRTLFRGYWWITITMTLSVATHGAAIPRGWDYDHKVINDIMMIRTYRYVAMETPV